MDWFGPEIENLMYCASVVYKLVGTNDQFTTLEKLLQEELSVPITASVKVPVNDEPSKLAPHTDVTSKEPGVTS